MALVTYFKSDTFGMETLTYVDGRHHTTVID
jgi:hypothetical protein